MPPDVVTTLLNKAQDITHLFCCKGTQLAHSLTYCQLEQQYFFHTAQLFTGVATACPDAVPPHLQNSAPNLPSAHSSSLFRSLWMTAQLTSESVTLPAYVTHEVTRSAL